MSLYQKKSSVKNVNKNYSDYKLIIQKRLASDSLNFSMDT
jgi:hypothetical protein